MQNGVFLWNLKKDLRKRLVRLSNRLFGAELTHRSRLAGFLKKTQVRLAETLSPARRRQAAFERLHPEAPWFVPDSIAFIEGVLSPSFTAFEWGAGRSTLWFARRIRRVISVEGRREWHDEVQQQIRKEELTDKVDLRLAEVTTEFAFKPEEVERYAGAIDPVPDHSLDLVVVDGHFRAACLERCLGKIREGGFLVIDNADVPDLEPYRRFLERMEFRLFTNGIWETVIIRAPRSMDLSRGAAERRLNAKG